MARLLAFLGLFLILSACAREEYSFTPPPTAGGQQCVLQCEQAKQFCYQGCGYGTKDCLRRLSARNMAAYDDYVRHQRFMKMPVEKSPSDFVTGECPTNNDCSETCNAIYRGCYGGCGGSVSRGY